MTVDDSEPDDRRDESADENDGAEDEPTDVPIDDSADEDPTAPADGGADTDGESNHWLSSLLSALESLENGSTSGRRRTDRTVLDYDISVRSGDDALDESRSDRTPIAGDGEHGPDRDRGRSRTRRRRSSSSKGLLTTRRHDDELLVTADIAGSDPDDVTVGFDDSTLVVAVSGSELDRVDVPWRDRTAEATIKNGILTVRITPDDESDGGTEETSTGMDAGDDS